MIKKTKIETRVTFAEYKLLCEVSRDYGFRSVYELLHAMVKIFLSAIKGQKYKTEVTAPREIEEMFDELSILDAEHRDKRREQL